MRDTEFGLRAPVGLTQDESYPPTLSTNKATLNHHGKLLLAYNLRHVPNMPELIAVYYYYYYLWLIGYKPHLRVGPVPKPRAGHSQMTSEYVVRFRAVGIRV